MKTENLSKVIVQEAYRFQFEKMTLWEEKLRLVIKPKPDWCPTWLYQWAINLVLKQERETTQGKMMPGGPR